MHIHNVAVPLGPDGRFYLGGLLPEDAENIQADEYAELSLNLCSGSISPSHFLSMKLVYNSTYITFDIPDPSEVVATRARLDYGVVCAAANTDHCASAILSPMCVMTPFGATKDFVTIRPIEENCVVADFNCDGDVDLQDFAGFQDLFTGPVDGEPE